MESKLDNIGISYTVYLTILSNWPVYLQFNTILNGTLKVFVINCVELLLSVQQLLFKAWQPEVSDRKFRDCCAFQVSQFGQQIQNEAK